MMTGYDPYDPYQDDRRGDPYADPFAPPRDVHDPQQPPYDPQQPYASQQPYAPQQPYEERPPYEEPSDRPDAGQGRHAGGEPTDAPPFMRGAGAGGGFGAPEGFTPASGAPQPPGGGGFPGDPGFFDRPGEPERPERRDASGGGYWDRISGAPSAYAQPPEPGPGAAPGGPAADRTGTYSPWGGSDPWGGGEPTDTPPWDTAARQDSPRWQDPSARQEPYDAPFQAAPPYQDSPYQDAPYRDSPYRDTPHQASPYADAPYTDSPYQGSPWDSGPGGGSGFAGPEATQAFSAPFDPPDESPPGYAYGRGPGGEVTDTPPPGMGGRPPDPASDPQVGYAPDSRGRAAPEGGFAPGAQGFDPGPPHGFDPGAAHGFDPGPPTGHSPGPYHDDTPRGEPRWDPSPWDDPSRGSQARGHPGWSDEGWADEQPGGLFGPEPTDAPPPGMAPGDPRGAPPAGAPPAGAPMGASPADTTGGHVPDAYEPQPPVPRQVDLPEDVLSPLGTGGRRLSDAEAGRDPRDPYGRDPYARDSYGRDSYGRDPYGDREPYGRSPDDDPEPEPESDTVGIIGIWVGVVVGLGLGAVSALDMSLPSVVGSLGATVVAWMLGMVVARRGLGATWWVAGLSGVVPAALVLAAPVAPGWIRTLIVLYLAASAGTAAVLLTKPVRRLLELVLEYLVALGVAFAGGGAVAGLLDGEPIGIGLPALAVALGFGMTLAVASRMRARLGSASATRNDLLIYAGLAVGLTIAAASLAVLLGSGEGTLATAVENVEQALVDFQLIVILPLALLGSAVMLRAFTPSGWWICAVVAMSTTAIAAAFAGTSESGRADLMPTLASASVGWLLGFFVTVGVAFLIGLRTRKQSARRSRGGGKTPRNVEEPGRLGTF